MHTIIVPGVGGSDYDHWQSWLQRQLMSCSRVQQQDWNAPLLSSWVQNFVDTVAKVNEPIQVIAHSFGCLTAVSALNEYPELTQKIKKMVLVAPANPARFGEQGFARDSSNDYSAYFHQLKLKVPCEMIISENDPWLNFEDAKQLAKAWNLRPHNLGQVGHINVASGFGPFPEIYNYMMTENQNQHISTVDESELFYRFAI